MVLKSFIEEWRLLLSKKINIVVLFILPVLAVILIGVEMNDEVIKDIPMAVIDYDQTDFSRGLIDAFDQNTIFNVIAYPESDIDLEHMMSDSEVRVGLIIPDDFYDQVATLQSPSVLMLYDGTHMSITSAAKSMATEILLTYKAGATVSQLTGRLGMTQEKALNIAQVFSFRSRTLYNSSKSFEDFLAPVLMAGYVQAAMVLLAAVSVNHSVFALSRKERMGYGLGKILFYTIAGTASYMLAVVTQVGVFDMPFVGKFFDVFVISLALCFAVAGFSVIISMVIKNPIISLLGGGIVFIPNSIMAGTTWPISAMPIGYQGFAAYMPFAKFANNLRNIYLKGSSLSQMMSDVSYLIGFGVVCVLITELILLIAEEDTLLIKDKEADDDVPEKLQERIQTNI